MSRNAELLHKAAKALNDGQIPLMNPFLADNDVTLDECIDLAELLAAGAEVVAWAIENPRIAGAAFQGMKMETLLVLMERAGWGEPKPPR